MASATENAALFTKNILYTVNVSIFVYVPAKLENTFFYDHQKSNFQLLQRY